MLLYLQKKITNTSILKNTVQELHHLLTIRPPEKYDNQTRYYRRIDSDEGSKVYDSILKMKSEWDEIRIAMLDLD